MTSDDQKTLYLVDGHAQFFRAYHAIRTGLTSPVTGEPTNMTFGFVGMLLKVLREHKPAYLVVVIDAAGDKETFRSELYPDYKANRSEPPEDLAPQIDRALAILRMMRVPVLAIPGVEADDVIATIVRRLQREQPELRIRIVSKDKDLTQLLNHNVELYDVHKDQAVTAAETFETPGLEPKHVLDVLTLMGDKIDNVPGVPGIGPKTAGQLILQYGSVDNLYAHLHEIKGKRRENLEAGRANIPLTRQLIQLKEDVPVEFDLGHAACCPTDLPVDELVATFRELGFNRYQDELRAIAGGNVLKGPDPSSVGRTASAPAPADGLFAHLDAEQGEPKSARGACSRGEYECVRTIEQLDALISRLRTAGGFAIDTETTGLSPISDELCGISVSAQPGFGAYIPVRSCESSTHLAPSEVIERLKPLLEDASVRKIGHNLKFDINVLRKAGIRLAGIAFDTMIASYVIDAGRSSHSMDVLALALLDYATIPITDLIGSGKLQRSFESVALDRATEYAAEDADVTLRLRDVMAPQLRAMGLEALFDQVEMPLVEVLAEMEWNGIRVDADELDRQRERLEKRVAALRRDLQDKAPFPFNPDSPKQLAAMLFNKPDQEPPGLGLKVVKRGKTGPSTDQEVLEKLAADPEIGSPIPRLVVEHRQLTKLVNTYLIALKEAINPISDRIHSSFNQTVAVTGRLSSNDPNLQNIPIRTEVGREIRRAFVAERTQRNWLNGVSASGAGLVQSDGWLDRFDAEEPNVLITADYSQIELRLLAHLSEDPALIEAFHSGQDIHTAVAADVFGVPADQVTSLQRGSAKMVNFGIVYGVTPFGLGRRLRMAGTDITDAQAGKVISDYKARYSRIAAFLERCVQAAMDQGYVETILKRRRAIPQIHARNPHQRALGERLAINSVVQGSAADLIKVAMIELQQLLNASRAGNVQTAGAEALARTRLILQIHDELVFETPASCAEPVAAIVKQRMQHAMELKVPLVADAAWSADWIDAK